MCFNFSSIIFCQQQLCSLSQFKSYGLVIYCEFKTLCHWDQSTHLLDTVVSLLFPRADSVTLGNVVGFFLTSCLWQTGSLWIQILIFTLFFSYTQTQWRNCALILINFFFFPLQDAFSSDTDAAFWKSIYSVDTDSHEIKLKAIKECFPVKRNFVFLKILHVNIKYHPCSNVRNRLTDRSLCRLHSPLPWWWQECWSPLPPCVS